ncbi:transmembrane protein [Ceratobasidium sp. AG-Ba]|nr:transmembrane protein [Ceratobasidium sp. AG-Ba]
MDAELSKNMPYTQGDSSIKPIPSWVYAIILFAIPLVAVLGYGIYSYMRRRKAASKSSNPAVVTVSDIEKQTSHKSQPSIGKWSLSVPKLPQIGRRGSDGGFPPETRHIAFPDPSRTLSTDSLDVKPPGLAVISPVTGGYPTPPRPVASK